MEFIFILVWIASIIISVFLNYLISKAFSEAAEAKGFYEKKYFWYCFFFGTIGYLLVISLPHRLYSAQHSDSYKHSNNPILHYWRHRPLKQTILLTNFWHMRYCIQAMKVCDPI